MIGFTFEVLFERKAFKDILPGEFFASSTNADNDDDMSLCEKTADGLMHYVLIGPDIGMSSAVNSTGCHPDNEFNMVRVTRHQQHKKNRK